MKYNLADTAEAGQALYYLLDLTKQEKMVEIKKIRPRRSLRQNNYLHLLLGAFGAHFGYTLEEAKQIYKEISKDIYYYENRNRTFVRSSADINTEEMTKSIDRFREASAKQDYPLPLATDQEWLRSLENEIERSGFYL